MSVWDSLQRAPLWRSASEPADADADAAHAASQPATAASVVVLVQNGSMPRSSAGARGSLRKASGFYFRAPELEERTAARTHVRTVSGRLSSRCWTDSLRKLPPSRIYSVIPRVVRQLVNRPYLGADVVSRNTRASDDASRACETVARTLFQHRVLSLGPR